MEFEMGNPGPSESRNTTSHGLRLSGTASQELASEELASG